MLSWATCEFLLQLPKTAHHVNKAGKSGFLAEFLDKDLILVMARSPLSQASTGETSAFS